MSEQEQDVTTPPLEGLGLDLPTLRRMVVDSPETEALLAKACGPVAEHGEIGGGARG